jgi:hypothetical protein
MQYLCSRPGQQMFTYSLSTKPRSPQPPVPGTTVVPYPLTSEEAFFPACIHSFPCDVLISLTGALAYTIIRVRLIHQCCIYCTRDTKIRYHQLEPDRRGDSIASCTILLLIRKKNFFHKIFWVLYSCSLSRWFWENPSSVPHQQNTC